MDDRIELIETMFKLGMDDEARVAARELACAMGLAPPPPIRDRLGEQLASLSKSLAPETPAAEFLADVATELGRARTKFPSSDASMTALTEEVGELAKALLSESDRHIYAEAVQVAAMAARVALEGDPTLLEYRLNHAPGKGPAKGGRP